MNTEKILTDFAKVINSDRYQYTESDIFVAEDMQEREAIFDMFFRKTEDNGFAVVSGIYEVIELINILNETSEKEKRKYFSEIIEEEHFVISAIPSHLRSVLTCLSKVTISPARFFFTCQDGQREKRIRKQTGSRMIANKVLCSGLNSNCFVKNISGIGIKDCRPFMQCTMHMVEMVPH